MNRATVKFKVQSVCNSSSRLAAQGSINIYKDSKSSIENW